MAGRRAAKISSDDQAGDTSILVHHREDEVLKPVSKAIHPDDWPCFVLKEAVVYKKDVQTPVSLLDVELEGPFTVRGRLEVDREYRHLRLIPKSEIRDIEIKNVTGFSMGIGPITIWARGNAGWYEIRPAATYQSIFEKMAQGITLYYFLADLYEGLKILKKAKGPQKTMDISQIFVEYARQSEESLSRSEIEKRCGDHASFLLSQMRQPGKPVNWPRTVFYKWLVEMFPKTYQQYKSLPDTNHPQARISDELGNKSSSLSSFPSAPNITKGHRQAPLILATMEELHSSGEMTRSNMTIRRLAKVLHRRFNIIDEHMGLQIIRIHAKRLFLSLGTDWATSPVYRELEEVLSNSRKANTDIGKEARAAVLFPRHHTNKHMPKMQQQSDVSSDDGRPCESRKHSHRLRSEFVEKSSSDEPVLILKPITNRKIRSTVYPENLARRPRGKGSISSSASEIHKVDYLMNTGSHYSDNEGENSAVSSHHLPQRRGPSRSGKIAGLRLKRPVTNQLTPSPNDNEGVHSGSKRRRKLSSSSATGDDAELEDNTSHEDRTPTLEPQDFLDENMLDPDSMEVKVDYMTVTSEALLSAWPQGPNGLWTCHRDGCNYFVRASDEPEGKTRVQAHFMEHADQIAAREDLALQESNRARLPINHLLEKLRSLGEAARLAEQRVIAGRVVPRPIKRRMFV